MGVHLMESESQLWQEQRRGMCWAEYFFTRFYEVTSLLPAWRILKLLQENAFTMASVPGTQTLVH